MHRTSTWMGFEASTRSMEVNNTRNKPRRCNRVFFAHNSTQSSVDKSMRIFVPSSGLKRLEVRPRNSVWHHHSDQDRALSNAFPLHEVFKRQFLNRRFIVIHCCNGNCSANTHENMRMGARSGIQDLLCAMQRLPPMIPAFRTPHPAILKI